MQFPSNDASISSSRHNNRDNGKGSTQEGEEQVVCASMKQEREMQKEMGSPIFRHVPSALTAQSLTDGVLLVPRVLLPRGKEKEMSSVRIQDIVNDRDPVVLPWVGFGTYKLGAKAEVATLQALQVGYRHIDTAFIYSRQRTEPMVGRAIQQALDQEIISSRRHVFVTTKHWRDYHGYEKSLECLALSLQRLNLEYIDLWLMHWPGPAWDSYPPAETNNDDGKTNDDIWARASKVKSAEEMRHLRSETWRAMEDAYLEGRVRAIGVCNFHLSHLQQLKETCRIVPMVNQVELHPLYPQTELLDYCRREEIVVQAYASLGGQDTTPDAWQELLGTASTKHAAADGKKDDTKIAPKKKTKLSKQSAAARDTTPAMDLLHAPPVLELAGRYKKTSAQILLKWALQQNCVVIPKSSRIERMKENAQLFDFQLADDQECSNLSMQLLDRIAANVLPQQDNDDDETTAVMSRTCLCWRGDQLRLLNF